MSEEEEVPVERPLDFISSLLVSSIKVLLDDNGAWEWNLRVVGLLSALFLGAIKFSVGKAHGVEWYGLLHSILTGVGAIVVIYLDFFASEAMTGIQEPLRAAQCHPPLTSLHRILPAMTLGYSLLDLFDGLHIGLDFILHGLATLSVMAFFIEHDRPQIVTPFLIMELSTIFLDCVRATFLDERGAILMQALFSFSFFLSRIVIAPIYHYNVTTVLFAEAKNSDCDKPYFKYVVLCFGLFFDCLNSFWFYKLVRKIRRKVKKEESVKANMSLDNTMKTE